MDASQIMVPVTLPLPMVQTIMQHLAQGKFSEVVGPMNALQQAGDAAIQAAQKADEAEQAELARLRALGGGDAPEGQPGQKIDPATPARLPADAPKD